MRTNALLHLLKTALEQGVGDGRQRQGVKERLDERERGRERERERERERDDDVESYGD